MRTNVNQHVSPLSQIYCTSLALRTDLYQLTMPYAHRKAGTADKEGVFNLFFCKNPFEGGFSVACGLTHTIDYIRHLQRTGFEDSDLAFLATLTGNDEQPLFEEKFLQYLGDMCFQCS